MCISEHISIQELCTAISNALDPHPDQVCDWVEEFIASWHTFRQDRDTWEKRRRNHFEGRVMEESILLKGPTLFNGETSPEGMLWEDHTYIRHVGEKKDFVNLVNNDSPLIKYIDCPHEWKMTKYKFHEALEAIAKRKIDAEQKESKKILTDERRKEIKDGILTLEDYLIVIAAWVPEDLHFDKEPKFQYPLPPQKRTLETYEMAAGLVAFHDAHVEGMPLFSSSNLDEKECLESFMAAWPFIDLCEFAKQQASDKWVSELRRWLSRVMQAGLTEDNAEHEPVQPSPEPVTSEDTTVFKPEVTDEQHREQTNPIVAVADHVTLRQMAAIVSKSKRTLERLRNIGELPAPDVKGGKGRADEWKWSNVRLILSREYGRQLPEEYPNKDFVRR